MVIYMDIKDLYEIAKDFAESKAKIKMPTIEKFEYDDFTHTEEFYISDIYGKILTRDYEVHGTESLKYEDKNKYISLKIDYDDDESYIQIIKIYDDYSIIYSKKI